MFPPGFVLFPFPPLYKIESMVKSQRQHERNGERGDRRSEPQSIIFRAQVRERSVGKDGQNKSTAERKRPEIRFVIMLIIKQPTDQSEKQADDGGTHAVRYADFFSSEKNEGNHTR